MLQARYFVAVSVRPTDRNRQGDHHHLPRGRRARGGGLGLAHSRRHKACDRRPWSPQRRLTHRGRTTARGRAAPSAKLSHIVAALRRSAPHLPSLVDLNAAQTGGRRPAYRSAVSATPRFTASAVSSHSPPTSRSPSCARPRPVAWLQMVALVPEPRAWHSCSARMLSHCRTPSTTHLPASPSRRLCARAAIPPVPSTSGGNANDQVDVRREAVGEAEHRRLVRAVEGVMGVRDGGAQHRRALIAIQSCCCWLGACCCDVPTQRRASRAKAGERRA